MVFQSDCFFTREVVYATGHTLLNAEALHGALTSVGLLTLKQLSDMSGTATTDVVDRLLAFSRVCLLFSVN